MNLRGLLHKYFYRDTCTVRRAVLTSIGKTDDYTTEFETVYENIPVHFAQYGVKSTGHRDDRAMSLTENYRVNIDPDYDVKENDVVEVVHHGQEFKLFVVKIFKYDWHCELDCKRRKEGGQQ